MFYAVYEITQNAYCVAKSAENLAAVCILQKMHPRSMQTARSIQTAKNTQFANGVKCKFANLE